MASPASRKRRGLVADENEESRGNVNVIPETPRKFPRNGDAAAVLETPKPENHAAAAAVIPQSELANVAYAAVEDPDASLMVTPHDNIIHNHKTKKRPPRVLKNPRARRALALDHPNRSPTLTAALPVTPAPGPKTASSTTVTPPEKRTTTTTTAKRRLIFGKLVDEIDVTHNTKRVYGLVKKLTGSLGGNGSCGPIYGELTQGSMQKMVNLMRTHAQLDATSRFIDVGSGIGKPNLHVAQDPGVAFSCGIEMELDRYRLGLKCLQSVLHQAVRDRVQNDHQLSLRHNCMFLHGNIMEAKTLDPFTHVYMFSIGFPPTLWVYLAEAWNRSQSPFLICFHGPRTILQDYEFDAELLAQMPTSMHASGEGHTGYIYRRKGLTQPVLDAYLAHAPCDPLFRPAQELVQAGLATLKEVVDQTVAENYISRGRSMTRSEARKHGVVLSKT